MRFQTLSAAFFIIAASAFFSFGAEEHKILPVFRKSDIGYVKIERDGVRLKHECRRFYIPPCTKLPVFQVEPSAYVLLVESKCGSFLCRIPRLSRYIIPAVISSDEKSAYFRGLVSSRIIPFELEKGEELPVLSEDSHDWLALVKRGDFQFPVLIPRKTPGVSFSTHSDFEKLTARQAEKGLLWYKGRWLAAERVKELRKLEKEKAEAEKKKWNNLVSGARKGYVIMSGGNILKGKLKGIGYRCILFETDGKERWINLDEASGVPLDEILAQGNLQSAISELDTAEKDFANALYGRVFTHVEQSMHYFKLIGPKTPDEYEAALQAMRKALALTERLDKVLSARGIAVHQGRQFPRDVLKYHLSRNHVLFRDGIWLERNQICSCCRGTGKENCPECGGMGVIISDCDKCDKGLIKCPLCKGEGWKECTRCNGIGEMTVKCSRCGGKGFIWETCFGFTSGPVTRLNTLKNGKTLINFPATGFKPFEKHRTTCPVCGGTGRETVTCPTCKGRGFLRCPPLVKCPYCKGRGFFRKNCTACSSTGRIPCRSCGGKGYTGEPQRLPDIKKTEETEGKGGSF